MEKTKMDLGFTSKLEGDFDAAEARVREALMAEGFGVLTEIDVQSTLKNKLDVDFRPYKILGACNPPLAHRALTAAPAVGLLLPCNVTLSQEEDGTIEVSIIDPMMMLSIGDFPELQSVADEVTARLKRVADALNAQSI
jgi:uncharacterized protein (DUF302 family)